MGKQQFSLINFFFTIFRPATRVEGPLPRTPPDYPTGISTGTPVPTASAAVGVAATSSTNSSCSRKDNSSAPWIVNTKPNSPGPKTEFRIFTSTDALPRGVLQFYNDIQHVISFEQRMLTGDNDLTNCIRLEGFLNDNVQSHCFYIRS